MCAHASHGHWARMSCILVCLFEYTLQHLNPRGGAETGALALAYPPRAGLTRLVQNFFVPFSVRKGKRQHYWEVQRQPKPGGPCRIGSTWGLGGRARARTESDRTAECNVTTSSIDPVEGWWRTRTALCNYETLGSSQYESAQGSMKKGYKGCTRCLHSGQ